MWKIKKSLLEDAMDTSENYYPREFLCFLSGNKKEEEVEEIVLLPSYNGENFSSINMNDMPIDDTIIGSLHSHPGGSVSPSSADKRFFKRFPINIIIGISPIRKKIGFYDDEGERTIVEVVE